MLLVFLADTRPDTAVVAAYAVESYLKDSKELFCPSCGSFNLYYTRKSAGGGRWMEMAVRCGGCMTSFAVPDTVMSGFWRGNQNEEAIDPYRFRSVAEESVVV